ncbi:MAG: hypothetical protein GY705_13570 [Bacteroidetes bacterium]|nr:hypothetical protein [Bacteroidota bacterium]
MRNSFYFVLFVSMILFSCNKENTFETFSISGKIINSEGEIVQGAVVHLYSGDNLIQTSENPEYLFSDLPEGGKYKLEPELPMETSNEANTFDVVQVFGKYLLGEYSLNLFQEIAADANKDDILDESDLSIFKTCLLNVEGNPCHDWRFITTTYDGLGSGSKDFAVILELTDNVADLDFYGIKIGSF